MMYAVEKVCWELSVPFEDMDPTVIKAAAICANYQQIEKQLWWTIRYMNWQNHYHSGYYNPDWFNEIWNEAGKLYFQLATEIQVATDTLETLLKTARPDADGFDLVEINNEGTEDFSIWIQWNEYYDRENGKRLNESRHYKIDITEELKKIEKTVYYDSWYKTIRKHLNPEGL